MISAEDKALILNIDDVGMLYSINQATIHLIKHAGIKSVSFIIHAPWSLDFISTLKRENLKVDLGLHLALNSEWPGLRIRPLLGESVPSLLDSQGFLLNSVEALAERANKDEIWLELNAQVMQAQRLNLTITHLDAHMLFYEAADEIRDLLFDLACKFNLPLLLYCRDSIRAAQSRNIVCPDFGTLENYWFPVGCRKEMYRQLFESLPQGVSAITLHPAVMSPELIACMGQSEAEKRSEEYTVFMETPPIISLPMTGTATLGNQFSVKNGTQAHI